MRVDHWARAERDRANMSERKFRIGDVVSMTGKIIESLGAYFRVQVGEDKNEVYLITAENLKLVQRALSIGDKVTGANSDPRLLSVAGEIIGIHGESAWIVRDDGSYTVCPLAGLKAV